MRRHAALQRVLGLHRNHYYTAWRTSTTATADCKSKPDQREDAEEDLGAKVSALKGMGLPSAKLHEFFCRNPKAAVSCSSLHFAKHLPFFKSMGINADGYCKIVSVYPQVLSLDMDKDLKASFGLLESALGKGLVAECVVSWPPLLGLGLGFPQQQDSSDKIGFLLKCGFKKNTKVLGKALSCVLHKSKQDLDAIMHAIMGLGLSHNHACRLVKMQPTILQQNPAEVTTKLDYILHTLCFSVEDLLKYSSFMIYSLDSHIKPRYLMHQWLRSKRLLRRNFKLDYIMSMSEKQFLCKFVECYADGLHMYHVFMGNAK